MYLLARRARLDSAAGVEWAVGILGRVKEVTGNDVQLWANAFSPGFGTVNWTSWWSDLATLEAAMTALQSDPGFIELSAEGPSFIEGAVDDMLIQVVHGELDANAPTNLAHGVQARCASGNAARALTTGIEVAQRVEAIAGVPTLFLRGLTGAYGAVGWLSGYDNMAGFETAQEKLAVDLGWLDYLDSTSGCYVEDVGITRSTLYTKLA
jgi:hypothetical protein